MVKAPVHRRGEVQRRQEVKRGGSEGMEVEGEPAEIARRVSSGGANQAGGGAGGGWGKCAVVNPTADKTVSHAKAAATSLEKLEKASHLVVRLRHWQWFAHLRQGLQAWEAAQSAAVARRIALLSSDLSGRRNTTRHERWLEAWEEETFKLFSTFATLESDPEIPPRLDSAAFLALLARTGALEAAQASEHDATREVSRELALDFFRRVLVPRGTKELAHADFVAALHLLRIHFEQQQTQRVKNAVLIDPNSNPAGSDAWRERRQQMDGRQRLNRLGEEALRSLSCLGGDAASNQATPPLDTGSGAGLARDRKEPPATIPRLGLEWASILAPPKVEQLSCGREGCAHEVPFSMHVEPRGKMLAARAAVFCPSCLLPYCSATCRMEAWSQGHKKVCLQKSLDLIHATPPHPQGTPPSSSAASVNQPQRPHSARPAVYYAIPKVFGGSKASAPTSVLAGTWALRRLEGGSDASARGRGDTQAGGSGGGGGGGGGIDLELYEAVAEWEARFLPRLSSGSRRVRCTSSAASARRSLDGGGLWDSQERGKEGSGRGEREKGTTRGDEEGRGAGRGMQPRVLEASFEAAARQKLLDSSRDWEGAGERASGRLSVRGRAPGAAPPSPAGPLTRKRLKRPPDATAASVDREKHLSLPATIESAQGTMPSSGPTLKARGPRTAGGGVVPSPPAQFPAGRGSASQQARRGAQSGGGSGLASCACIVTAREAPLHGTDTRGDDPVIKGDCGGCGGWEGTALEGIVGGAAFNGTYGGGCDGLVRPDEEREGRRAPLLIATQAAASQVQGGQTLRGAAEKERQVVGGVGSGTGENSGWLQALANFREAVSVLQGAQGTQGAQHREIRD